MTGETNSTAATAAVLDIIKWGRSHATSYASSFTGAFAVPEHVRQPVQPAQADRRRRCRPSAPALILGGLGSAGVSALSRTSTGRLLQSSAEPVTFGSNYSDPVDSEAIAAAVEATGVPTTINTVDHNTYQENFNTYIQQPDDVMSWFAGYRMRAFANRGVVGDVSDVWEGLDRLQRGFQERLDSGSTASSTSCPSTTTRGRCTTGRACSRRPATTIPTTWDEFKALLDQMQTDGITPLAAANDGKLAADGHVRHAQPADQRLRLPRLADGRPGELDRRPRQGRLHGLGGDPPLLPARRQRPHVAGRGDRTRQRRSRDDAARHVHRLQLRPGRRSRTSSTTSTSSPSRRSTTSTARTPSRRRSTGS